MSEDKRTRGANGSIGPPSPHEPSHLLCSPLLASPRLSFDHVTAIIFVVALSEFDETLFEESKVNRLSSFPRSVSPPLYYPLPLSLPLSAIRMMDSLNLFASICRNPHLRGIPVILFLNKVWSLSLSVRSALIFTVRLVPREGRPRVSRQCVSLV
jgi:hypothetical protein